MKTILVVDDEENIAKMLGEQLEDDGYKVIVATNGADGLRKVQIVKPDLIVLDVMMPKMDGGEMFAKLKQNEKTRNIPIVFLTALKTQVDDFLIGRDVLPDDFREITVRRRFDGDPDVHDCQRGT